MFSHLGAKPPRGVLLCGTTGSGKSMLVNALCGELEEIPFFKLSGPEIVSSLSGESESNIRGIFKDVMDEAPAVLFIDDIDSIAGKKSSQFKDMEKRIVTQLVSCIDDLEECEKPVIVIGATSRPENLDETLRRAGRFDRELTLKVPSEEDRSDIITVLTSEMRI